jgi:hypothetical protein
VLAHAAGGPRDVLFLDVDLHVLGQVVDLGVFLVGRVAGRVHVDARPEKLDDAREPVVGPDGTCVGYEPVAEAERRESERATGVLLLRETEEVRGKADLRLDLFFAVPEVIVGEDRHHDAVDGA